MEGALRVVTVARAGAGAAAGAGGGGASIRNHHFAATWFPSASTASLVNATRNALPPANGESGVKVSWVAASFQVTLPSILVSLVVSVTRRAFDVASVSIGWLNHISREVGLTSWAPVSGSDFVSCAPDWTMNEKFAL